MPTQDLTIPNPPKIKDLPLPPGLRDNPELRAYMGYPELTGPQPHVSLPASQIVPEEYQNRLMAIEDTMTRSYFEIGDIANMLIEYVPQVSRDKKLITQQDVYNAVGVFCHRTGRTVRYYAETSAFYPLPVRSEFDLLPFNVFVLARYYGAAWRKVLEFARQNPTMSEDTIRKQFADVDGNLEDTRAFYKEHPELASILSDELSDFRVPGSEDQDTGMPRFEISTKGNNPPTALFLSRLSNLADSLERIVHVIDEQHQAQVRDILAKVRDLVMDLQKETSM